MVELCIERLAFLKRGLSLFLLVEPEQTLPFLFVPHVLLLRLGIEAHIMEILLALLVAFHEGNHIDEVWVVGVYVTEFDLDEALDHLFGFAERLQQQRLHHFEDTLSEVLVPLNFGDLDGVDHPSQLLVDQVGTLKRGELQPEDLGFEKGLEGCLREEEGFSEAVRVADGCSNVQIFVGVY